MTDPGLAPPPSPGDSRHPQASRRTWLVASMAGVAALAGVGLSWLTRAPEVATDAGLSAFWTRSFDVPGHAPLAMSGFAGHPLLLNFWATWCAPCIEELPLLDRFYAENSAKNWQVLGLAVDETSSVQAFLRHAPVRFPIAMAGMAGIQLSKTLGNLGGGLPFTIVIGSGGQVLHRKMGRVQPADLLLWSTLR